MEEHVEPGADHLSLGWPGKETTADVGKNQRESRRDAAEVQLKQRTSINVSTCNSPHNQHLNYSDQSENRKQPAKKILIIKIHFLLLNKTWFDRKERKLTSCSRGFLSECFQRATFCWFST